MRKLMPLMALATIAALIGLAYLIVSFTRSNDQPTDFGYGGQPISDTSDYFDWDKITERNSEGFKVDEYGMIPVANDGGPIFPEFVPEEAGGQAISKAICQYAPVLERARSRENRSALFEYLHEEAKALEGADGGDRKLVPLVQAVTSYNIGNPQIKSLVEHCS